MASILVFFAVIRRELNHLSELFVAADFAFLGHTYDWWEDGILLIIYLVMLGLLIYTWRYFWVVLKRTPISLYVIVAVLALLQYMGENAILIPEALGEVVEETTEAIVYTIALLYLWKIKLSDFKTQSINQ